MKNEKEEEKEEEMKIEIEIEEKGRTIGMIDASYGMVYSLEKVE